MTDLHCPPCDPDGTGRHCARYRCYCEHPECWAADSYQSTRDRRARNIPPPPPKKGTRR